MKKFTFFFSFLWLSFVALGQAPQGISYQTVIRDGSGQPLLNTAITLKMTIRTAAPDGAVVYSETHPKTTGTFGLVTLAIGQGTPVEGNFASIDWGAAPHFLETAIDATGTGDFQILGITQFLSVPYALNSLNGMPAGNNPGDMLYWDGSQWMKIAVGQNGQALILQNGIPTWGGVQLPILNTAAVTNITAFTAYSGGNIASDGGSPVVGRGICWNTSPNPTTANFKIFAGSGSGNFLAQMTGLESSTQYFVRAFATNSAGTSYGQEMTFFTTAGAITLSTTAITNITVNSATSGGNITLNGGSPVTARGVCWNTAPYPTITNNKTTDGTGNGAFVSQLTGLTNNTTYYVRAYATNSLGTSYGNQLTFTTLSGIVTLTTAEVTGITSNSAISGGEISSDGGSPVTVRGVCWNTLPNPTTANFITSDGTGTGTFTSNITGLSEDTTYYIRAYATNGFGTWYGNEVSFETPVWECGNPIVDSRDGQSYNTVQIGGQCWMSENLNVGARIDGSQNQTDNGAIEKYCYDNLESNCDVYGGLYQWDEMMRYSTVQGIQGICPNGWYLPSYSDWELLVSFINTHPEYLCNSSTEYNAKCLASPLYWDIAPFECSICDDFANNNSTGFTGLPGGLRSTNNFNELNYFGFFWSSTIEDMHAYTKTLTCMYSFIDYSALSPSDGVSVRCIKSDSFNSNKPPTIPSNPYPDTNSINVGLNTYLSWSCSDPDRDSLTYDVFFGTENPPSQVTIAISDTFYFPGNLDYNTNYNWKIVAHDNNGNITEGEIWGFTTRSEAWQCGDDLFDERDAKEYNTLKIGEQCWMAENLNFGNRIDGSQNQQNNGTSEKYCYNNQEINCDNYGGLYQWYEAMNYTTTNGVRGICPTGWHLPNDNEWNSLTTYINNQSTNRCNGNISYIGKSMASKTNWNTDTGTCTVGNNLTANNATGFNGLPSGYRVSNGTFYYFGEQSCWWTSTDAGDNFAWYIFLTYYSPFVDINGNHKGSGLSVRCLFGEGSPPNQLPNYPSNPFPETGSTNISINPTLSWSCTDPEGDPLTYDVFFGTENLPTQVATAIADTLYTPETLNFNTTYYWKIVAHDDHGNSTEGVVWSFTTKETWDCGDPFTDSRDNQTYNTTMIGDQCWMAQNINIGNRINSNSEQQNNGVIEKYCIQNSETFCNTYGGLYQWDEMMYYSSVPGAQGICPSGWHLPTDMEWCSLSTFHDPTVNCSAIQYTGADAGGKMKEVGTSHWIEPNIGATNLHGFTALPGGVRLIEGSTFDDGYSGNFWTSSSHETFLRWFWEMSNNKSSINRQTAPKEFGFSVRCIKGESLIPQLSVTPTNKNVSATAGTTSFTLNSNTTWSVSESISWLSVTPLSGSNNSTLSVTYQSNSSSSSRIGQITITATGGYPIVTISITQAGTSQFSCGQLFTDNRDGKLYSTIQIGNQCWMKENLNIGNRINKTTPQTSNGIIEKYCYNDSDINCDVYGGLYRWDEMMNYNTIPGTQGICPNGWHLPTIDEWSTLTNYVSSQTNFRCSGNSGFIAKSLAITSGWNTSTITCAVGNDLISNNATGFSGYPGGNCRGQYSGINNEACWWTSSEGYDFEVAEFTLMYFNQPNFSEAISDKSGGYSVRCIKN